MIAVYLGTNRELWKKYISSKGMNEWINGFDPYGGEKIEEKYDLYAMPMIYLLDGDQRVLASDVPADRLMDLIHP